MQYPLTKLPYLHDTQDPSIVYGRRPFAGVSGSLRLHQTSDPAIPSSKDTPPSSEFSFGWFMAKPEG